MQEANRAALRSNRNRRMASWRFGSRYQQPPTRKRQKLPLSRSTTKRAQSGWDIAAPPLPPFFSGTITHETVEGEFRFAFWSQLATTAAPLYWGIADFTWVAPMRNV